MNGLEATDAFFELITAAIAPKLVPGTLPPLSHWTVVSDVDGTVVDQLDDDTEGMAIDSVLAGHIDGGASAAAFLTLRDGFVLAQVLIADPRNSDLRRSRLTEVSGELRLSPWTAEL